MGCRRETAEITNSTPLVRGIHEHEKAVVDNPLAVFVRHLQGLSVQHQRNGAAPLGIPGFVGDFIAVGVEPGDVLDDADEVRHLPFLRISRS